MADFLTFRSAVPWSSGEAPGGVFVIRCSGDDSVAHFLRKVMEQGGPCGSHLNLILDPLDDERSGFPGNVKNSHLNAKDRCGAAELD